MNKQNISNMTIIVNKQKDLKKLADELRAEVDSFKKKYDGILSWKDVNLILKSEKTLSRYEGGEA
jgi:hypothetical protein